MINTKFTQLQPLSRQTFHPGSRSYKIANSDFQKVQDHIETARDFFQERDNLEGADSNASVGAVALHNEADTQNKGRYSGTLKANGEFEFDYSQENRVEGFDYGVAKQNESGETTYFASDSSRAATTYTLTRKSADGAIFMETGAIL